MAELSPAAKAVLDAATERWLDVDDDIPAQVAIAALRAAASQMASHSSKTFLYSIADYWKLNALAAELEGNQ